jgi:hypothetical protein
VIAIDPTSIVLFIITGDDTDDVYHRMDFFDPSSRQRHELRRALVDATAKPQWALITAAIGTEVPPGFYADYVGGTHPPRWRE